MAQQQKLKKSLFLAAIEIETATERNEFLTQKCGDNQELRNEIVALLDAHDDPPEVLGRLNNALPTINPDNIEVVGQQIGPYKVLEAIGEGGMGTVYMAKQTHPINRRVALKLIKTGMDTKQVIGRFEAERQAIAMMDHPNIAKVFDAGSTESGRPYFVMELVKGLPITKFCDEQQLNVVSRLKLFQKVCHAVQHAHQKGIIHRDLKPSNIMVAMYDDLPIPKVIDFGVAKATGDELTEKTMFTRFDQIVGTLEYMSPEQAQFNQLDIDTRSDVYSLGAVLYELLAGEPPFNREKIKSQALDETLRMIREDEPTKPSTKLSSTAQLAKVASNRNTSSEKLGSIVCGDLDWIVMKALEKDRSRRYETANGLASDLDRYLNDDPVYATPPSAMYRFRKFTRRNKGQLIAGACILLALVGGTGVSTWKAVEASRANYLLSEETKRATNAEKEAKADAEMANAVNEFINVDLLGKASPHSQPNRDLTIRDALDQAVENIDARFIDKPLVRASIQRTIGKGYGSLGEYEAAIRCLEPALSTYMQHFGLSKSMTVDTELDLLWVLHDQGKYKTVRSRLEELSSQTTDAFGQSSEITLKTHWQLAEILCHLGEDHAAEEIIQSYLPISRSVLGPKHPITIRFVMQQGITLIHNNMFPEAEQQFRKAYLLCQQVYRTDHPNTINAMKELANAIAKQQRWKDAVEQNRNVLEIEKRVMGPNHPDTVITKTRLVKALINLGLIPEAILIEREVLVAQRKTLGPMHRDTLETQYNFAQFNASAGRLEEAERISQDLLPIVRDQYSSDDPLRIGAVRNLGAILARLNRIDETSRLLRDELDTQLAELGPEHEVTQGTIGVLVDSYELRGEFELAKNLLETRIKFLDTKYQDSKDTRIARQLTRSLKMLVKIQLASDDLQATVVLCEQLATIYQGLASLVPDDAGILTDWGASLSNVAHYRFEILGDDEQDSRSLESCISLLDEAEEKTKMALRLNPSLNRANNNLRIILRSRAEAYLKVSCIEEAASDYGELVRLTNGPDRLRHWRSKIRATSGLGHRALAKELANWFDAEEFHLGIASAFAHCWNEAKNDLSLSALEQTSLRSQYFGQAMTHLKKAIDDANELSLEDIEDILNSNQFDAIRDEKEFQELVTSTKKVIASK